MIRREEISEAVLAIERGEVPAEERLFSLVYDELRGIARRSLQSEPAGQSLDSAALVHEAYLRLVGDDAEWEGRRHFIGAAARAMRRILVEHARKRQRRARHLEQIPLAQGEGADVASFETSATALVLLDGALDRLGQKSKRKHDVVMMRYFAGLSIAETSRALSISPATVKSDWSFARAWLYREIERELGR